MYYKSTVIKTVRDWHKDRLVEQWCRAESPETNLCQYNQMIENKCAKTSHWGKDSPFNKWFWKMAVQSLNLAS